MSKLFPSFQFKPFVDSYDSPILFTIAGTANEDLYVLPDGQVAYIAKNVKAFMRYNEISHCNACRLDGEKFDLLMQEIDNAPSNKKMVLAKRVGKGPSEKSAKYDVEVIQRIQNHETQGEVVQQVHTIEFTLPVSQIEDMGEGQLAAPLWLILEKLNAKLSSAWGSKHRSRNGVVSEFVPAPLNSKKCHSKSELLKAWLATQRDVLLVGREAKIEKQQQEQLMAELKPIADEVFSIMAGKFQLPPYIFNILKQKFPEIYESEFKRTKVVTLIKNRFRELNNVSKTGVSI